MQFVVADQEYFGELGLQFALKEALQRLLDAVAV
jgi:hypothetical protein